MKWLISFDGQEVPGSCVSYGQLITMLGFLMWIASLTAQVKPKAKVTWREDQGKISTELVLILQL